VRLVVRRREADAALAEMRLRESVWRAATRDVRAWAVRHRASVIVGSGFVTGLATSLFPIAALLRLTSAFAGTVSLMLEGPFLRLLSTTQRQAAQSRADGGTAAAS
jgi:hypothetical protein